MVGASADGKDGLGDFGGEGYDSLGLAGEFDVTAKTVVEMFGDKGGVFDEVAVGGGAGGEGCEEEGGDEEVVGFHI